jgi:hypothetical protein
MSIAEEAAERFRRLCGLLILLAALSRMGMAQQAWLVDTLPYREIDVQSLNANIGAPRSVVQFPSGRIAMVDTRTSQLRFLDATGRVDSLASANADRFRYISWVGLCADSLVALDLMLQRFFIVDDAGTIQREIRLPSRDMPAAIACAPSGAIAMQLLPSMQSELKIQGTTFSGSSQVVVLDSRGPEIGRTAPIATSQFLRMGGGIGTKPFGTATLLALTNSRLLVARSDSAVMSVYSHAGQPAGRFRIPVEIAPVDSEVYANAVEDLAEMVPASARSTARSAAQSAGIPPSASTLRQLLVDKEGCLWISRSETRIRTMFDVFRDDGTFVASVDLPRSIKVSHVTTEYIIGTKRLDSRVTHIVVYHFARHGS